MGQFLQDRRSSPRPDDQSGSRHSELPLIGRFIPAPIAAKVPEVILVFWVVKILTTAGGEATSDYLKTYGNFGGGGIEIARDRRRAGAAVRHPPLPGVRLLVPGLRDRDHRDRRLGLPAPRRPHPLCGDDAAVGGRPRRDLLALAAQRGHALDPQHHHPATGGATTGRRCSRPSPSGPRSETSPRPR